MRYDNYKQRINKRKKKKKGIKSARDEHKKKKKDGSIIRVVCNYDRLRIDKK